MSGIKRQLQAKISADGKTSTQEVTKMFSPEGMRAEKGQSIYTCASICTDKGAYTGKKSNAN